MVRPEGERLDELLTAIKTSSLLVKAAAQRLEQRAPYSTHDADRPLVDVWLRLILEVVDLEASGYAVHIEQDWGPLPATHTQPPVS